VERFIFPRKYIYVRSYSDKNNNDDDDDDDDDDNSTEHITISTLPHRHKYTNINNAHRNSVLLQQYIIIYIYTYYT
jgi:hypothetical protein